MDYFSNCKVDDFKMYHHCAYCNARNSIKSPHQVELLNPSLHNSSLSEQPRLAPLKFLEPIYTHYRNALAHMCASPNRVDSFICGYAFPNKKHLSDEYAQYYDLCMNNEMSTFRNILEDRFHGEVYVNATHECMKEFSKYLVRLSKKPKSDEISRKYDRVMFLTGDYGEGKSIFVNYVQSVFMYNIFNHSNTIVIKIDYTDLHEVEIEHFKERIGTKTLRILRDKYFLNDNKKECFSVPNIDGYLSNCGLDEAIKSQVIRYLRNTQADINLPKEMTYYDIYRLIKQYITTTLNHSFVFLIDGLDNFHRDIVTENIFKKRCRELAAFITGDEICDSTYLIVMRTESYNYLLQSSHQGRDTRTKWKRVSLLPVHVNDLIEAKFKLFELLLKTEAEVVGSTPQDPFDEDNREARDISRSFTKNIGNFKQFFIEYVICGLEEGKDSSLELLNNIFNNNNRNITEGLATVARDLLHQIERVSSPTDATAALEFVSDLLYSTQKRKDFIRRYRWLCMRSLMLNRYSLCSEAYEYKEEEKRRDTSWRIGPHTRVNHSSRTLIPNLFYAANPATYVEKSRLEQKPYTFHLLIKVRILQYYNFCKHNSELRTFKDTKTQIEKCFGYLEPWTMYECRMLYATQCLQKTAEIDTDASSGYPMRITPTGMFLINNLIYRYSYLENVIDNIFVPMEFGKRYLSPAESLVRWQAFNEHDKVNCEKFAQALARKMSKVVAFVSLIKHIDELERKAFIENTGHQYFSFDPHAHTNDLLISHQMLNSVSQTLDRIFHSTSELIQTHTKTNLSSYIHSKINEIKSHCIQNNIECQLM